MMGMVYKFRLSDKQFPVDAQIAGEAIEAIGGHNSGEVTPDMVVDAARPDSHPLHPVFEWDDTKAAEEHRRSQARYLLRSVVAFIPESKQQSLPTRAFVSVRPAKSEGAAYVPIKTAMSDPELRQQVLAGAMRELVSWRKRHQELQELADLFVQIDMFAERHHDDDEKALG